MKREVQNVVIRKEVIHKLKAEVEKMRPRVTMNAYVEYLIEEFLESKKLKLHKTIPPQQ